jgi:dCMP deaminase
MMLINCGVKRIVCERKYQLAEESDKLFNDAGVTI